MNDSGIKEVKILEDDYRDMITALVEEKVQFLLVGGYAVGVHGYQRPTKDIDFLVWPNPENALRVIKALEKFGAPMHDISVEDFEKEGTVFQIGVQPVRIDIVTAIVDVNFEEAYRNAQMAVVDGINFPVIPLQDLIKNKRAAGRPRDLNDAEHLEVILKKKSQAGAR
ncbi:MAG: nucleotidyl transferase AbiEii/AbiGii toxin family protein [Chitinispirillia bacterium]|nr:nucleotidyl transferase AbiEii/AbiGii toxin family protein [Chitinispirillia bacterium]MCL2241864.1 nucleotidyl transferase AbiEii/AbiGii toxin family protein [Chitinispirillia bacterium]